MATGVQHQVLGNDDNTFAKLGSMYGIPWEDIAIATTGHSDAHGIYNWMESMGCGVPQGYWAAGSRNHLSLKAGAIVLIPGVSESMSPIGDGEQVSIDMTKESPATPPPAAKPESVATPPPTNIASGWDMNKIAMLAGVGILGLAFFFGKKK